MGSSLIIIKISKLHEQSLLPPQIFDMPKSMCDVQVACDNLLRKEWFETNHKWGEKTCECIHEMKEVVLEFRFSALHGVLMFSLQVLDRRVLILNKSLVLVHSLF